MIGKAISKTKLVLLLDILREETDEEHSLTTAQLIGKLEENEIHCDRKTLYSDIQALRDYGFDIEQDASVTCKSRTSAVYIFKYFVRESGRQERFYQ